MVVRKSKQQPEYLEDEFDAAKLTKPQLRSILAEHGIMDLPPATARKEVLLELFDQHVAGRAGEIKRARSRVRASDKGISFLDERSQPSPKRSPTAEGRPKRGRSRSSKARATTERGIEGKEQKDLARSPTRPKGQTRASPSPSPSPSPMRKRSPSHSPTRSRAASKRTASKKRLETLRSSSKAKGKPLSKSPSRPRSESPLAVLQRAMPRYADSPGAATSKLHDRLEYIANANRLLDAGKVITSSTSRSISTTSRRALTARSRSRSRSGSRTPPSTRRQSLAGRMAYALSSSALLGGASRRLGTLLYYVTMMVLAVLLGGYLRYKFFYELPYCDNAVTLHKYLPKSMQLSIFSSLSEMCIPCPIHGKCSGGRLSCLDGFVARRNWIAFGHDCIPDKRRLSLVDDLTTKMRQSLAERAGRVICGDLPELGRVVTAGELAALVRSKHPRAEWNSAQFDSFFRMALEDISRNAAAMGIEVSHNPMYVARGGGLLSSEHVFTNFVGMAQC